MHDEPAQPPPATRAAAPERHVSTVPAEARQLDPALPRPLTSFVGRDRETEAVCDLLARDDVRLVTLTGPGGVGKTRLSLQVAVATNAFHDGVWFVDLAPFYDPDAVAPAIGRAIGIQAVGDQQIEDRIIAFLRERRVLLVLDNLEQILGAGLLVTNLLIACSRLAILVTSRVALRVTGEHRVVVPPLVLSEDRGDRSSDSLHDSEAVRLFVDRAGEIASAFTLTDRNAADVAAICARLEGMPLAIELAAARMSVFSPADVRKRLDERLPVLAEGPRNAPQRLRSMRASIAWSHELLSPGERALFRQLGALVGTWTLDAAEAVAGCDDAASCHRVLEHFAALVDASLVRPQADSTSETTYRMLVPIQEFAEELLDRSNESEVVRRRHAVFVTGLAAKAEVAIFLAQGERVIAHLRIHAPNVLTALGWLERQGDVDGVLRLAASLPRFWNLEGQIRVGRALLERAVALGRESRSPRLGKALIALGALLHLQGEEPLALELCREGERLVEEHGDLHDRFLGYANEGLITLRDGDLETSVAAQERALELVRAAPHVDWAPRAESSVLGNLGYVAFGRGDIDTAERYFEQALAVQRSLGHEPGTSHIMASLPIVGLADVARARRDLPVALARYREALVLARQFHDYRAALYALGGVAGTLAASGNWRVAARLFGADEALHERGGYHFGLETTDRQRALGLPEPWMRQEASFGTCQRLHDAIWSDRPAGLPPIPDPAAAAELWEAGRALAIDAAVAEALAADLGPPVREGGEKSPGGLTPREAEVLRLLTEGRSDQEIADVLYISRRTAATHVAHIYDKLGVSSRVGAAAWAIRHGLA